MTIQQFADKHRLRTRVDRDDGTVIIPGKLGHVYEYDPDENLLGVMVMPKTPRRQYWGFCRREFIALAMTIRQNGDMEGAASFNPDNPAQVKAAIKAAGIKRRRVMSEKQRMAANLALERARRPRQGHPALQDEPMSGK